MAGLPWIEVATDLPRQSKSVLLGMKLNDPRAWTYRLSLWLWCAEQCPEGSVTRDSRVTHADGNVSHGTDEARAILEFAMGWTGEPGRLFAACVECRIIDVTEGEYVVHGWAEYSQAHIEKRKKDAERQANRRKKVAERFAPKDAGDVTPESRVSHADIRGNKNTNTNTNTDPPRPKRPGRVGVGSPAFEAVEHWRVAVWPKLSTAECPDLPADQVQSLAALCGKHGPPAVMAAMDAAAADSFWHGKLDLSVFISKFPRFLGRKTGAQSTPGRKRVVGVDDNGQPIFSEDAA